MFKLPLKLKVVGIERNEGGVHVNCNIVDSEGSSVQYVPVTVGPKTPAAGLCAILQSRINQLAEVMHKQGLVVLAAEGQTEEETEVELQALVGREFTGSVAT
jgi:hypothetical protein